MRTVLDVVDPVVDDVTYSVVVDVDGLGAESCERVVAAGRVVAVDDVVVTVDDVDATVEDVVGAVAGGKTAAYLVSPEDAIK